MGKVIGDIAGALVLATLPHHLCDLRHDCFLPGDGITLGIELAGSLKILVLCIKRGQPCLIDALGTGCTLGLLLFAFIVRSEEHTSELQSLMRISYAVFCLKKKISNKNKRILDNA